MSVPVNRAPPEILSRVLEYRTSERDLVAATHVCRYWRSTLISSSSLWSCFQFRSSPDLDRTLTYLERSKLAPIHVSIDTGSSRDLGVLDYLAPQITRMRSLIIRASHGIYTASLLLCNPAPSLQHLEIRTSGGAKPLPENFLGRQAPSLRSVKLSCVYPEFESLFPLPNLTEFYLLLPDGASPFRMGELFRLFSGCPLLQKIGINIRGQIVQDITPGQVISLESLVELDYTCNFVDLILPFLRLPRLKKLWVTSLGPGQVQKLADILPHDGHVLLAGATKIFYHFDPYARSLRVDLSENGVDVSLNAFCATTVDWLSDQALIPLEQIEDLKVGGSPSAVGPPISVFALENLRVLRVTPWNPQFTEEFFRLLHPGPGTGVPCPSLREIEYTCYGPQEPLPRSLTGLFRERKRAGHQLRLFCLLVRYGSGQDLVEELREDVGEVQVRGWNERV